MSRGVGLLLLLTACSYDVAPRPVGPRVSCSVDSATVRALGLVRLDVRPAGIVWRPGLTQQFCCFGTLADGRKIKFLGAWNDPYCESQYQQFLAELPI